MTLKKAGVDTSLGIRGRKRRDNPIQVFLDDEWMVSAIGRSPKRIASRLNVEVIEVNTVLRHRRDSLVKKAERVPLEDDSWFTVDPYRMRVEFNLEDSMILMTETEMETAIRESQDLSA